MRKSYLKGTRILLLFTLVVWLFTISATVITIKPFFGNFGDKTQNTEKYTTGLDGNSYIKLLAIEETNITDDKVPLNNSAWKNEFNEKIYIRTLTTADTVYSFIGLGFFIMITLVMTTNVIKRIRSNINSYDTLFYKYPETRYDMDLIVRDANFINKELKIIVYKDLLIIYKTTFIVEEISDIEEMLFRKNSAKGKNEHTLIYNTHFDNKNREIKMKRVSTEDFIATAKTLRKDYKIKIIINV